MTAERIRLRAALVAVVCAAALFAVLPAGAGASSGGWWVDSTTVAPTSVAPGEKALIAVNAVNAGYKEITSTTPVKVTVEVPAGLKVASINGVAGAYVGTQQHPEIHLSCAPPAQTVICEMTTGALHPKSEPPMNPSGRASNATNYGPKTPTASSTRRPARTPSS